MYLNLSIYFVVEVSCKFGILKKEMSLKLVENIIFMLNLEIKGIIIK